MEKVKRKAVSIFFTWAAVLFLSAGRQSHSQRIGQCSRCIRAVAAFIGMVFRTCRGYIYRRLCVYDRNRIGIYNAC